MSDPRLRLCSLLSLSLSLARSLAAFRRRQRGDSERSNAATLIFLSLLLPPPRPVLPADSRLARGLIRSLLGERATQLYSYKRKLHQEVPITFRANCRLTFPLGFRSLHARAARLPRRYLLFSGFPFQFPVPFLSAPRPPPPPISLALSASALSPSRGK